MLEVLPDIAGFIIEVLRRNSKARLAVTWISLASLAFTSVLSVSSFLYANPVPFSKISDSVIGAYIIFTILLALAAAAYTGITVKGGGVFRLELESLHEERKDISDRLADKQRPDILDTIQLSLNQLSEYYTINKSQARNSFGFSVSAVVFGLATTISGIWMFYFGDNPRVDLAAITSLSGVLLQFIGGAYFYLYRRSLEQLNFFFSQLVKMQDTMLSIKLCDQIESDERRFELREKIAITLLERAMARGVVASDSHEKANIKIQKTD
jgi:hypothetical protein